MLSAQFQATLTGKPPAWLPTNAKPKQIIAREMVGAKRYVEKGKYLEALNERNKLIREDRVMAYKAILLGKRLTVSEIVKATGKTSQAVRNWMKRNEGRYVQRHGMVGIIRYSWIEEA